MQSLLPYLQWVPVFVAAALVAARVTSTVLRRTNHTAADAAFRRRIKPVIDIFKLADEPPHGQPPR